LQSVWTLKIFDFEEGSKSHPSVFEDQGNALGKHVLKLKEMK
jgi:hypothetical protein